MKTPDRRRQNGYPLLAQPIRGREPENQVTVIPRPCGAVPVWAEVRNAPFLFGDDTQGRGRISPPKQSQCSAFRGSLNAVVVVVDRSLLCRAGTPGPRICGAHR